MDPALRQKLFIRKRLPAIISLFALILVLPFTIAVTQTTTQTQQQAAEANNPAQTSNPPNYETLTKCFDKPNQTNPCSPEEHKSADLNKDGVVNGTDYNIFLHQKK